MAFTTAPVSRYSAGGILYFHKGKKITSSVGSPAFDAFTHGLVNQSYQLGTVPPEYAHRPDLIASVWLGSTEYWWQIMIINGIFDPFESLNRGDPILLPKV